MGKLFEWYNWMFFNQVEKNLNINSKYLKLVIGTSIIFFNSQKQILMMLRDNIKQIPYPNCWDVLGGGLEDGESPKKCIIREMEEEIEVVLENPPFFKKYLKWDRIEYAFWQQVNFNLDEINLHEGQMLKWFSKTEIEALHDNAIAFEFEPIIMEFYEKLDSYPNN